MSRCGYRYGNSDLVRCPSSKFHDGYWHAAPLEIIRLQMDVGVRADDATEFFCKACGKSPGEVSGGADSFLLCDPIAHKRFYDKKEEEGLTRDQ